MTRRARLDAELVRRGLARSREQAVELVAAGRVSVRGQAATKPATGVAPGDAVVVRADPAGPAYASRGGHKLAGALASFGAASPPLVVTGRRALDAGASTGGFTDVLLRAGATSVVAVDVGYGQLAWALRSDPRVTVLDRTNVRSLTPEAVGGRAELVVADLSFISLLTVLPSLLGCTAPTGDLVLLVKPQFEVGRDRLGDGGVVRDPALRAESAMSVAAAAQVRGWGTRGLVASSLPGPAGNRELLLWLARGAPPLDEGVAATAAADPPRSRHDAPDRSSYAVPGPSVPGPSVPGPSVPAPSVPAPSVRAPSVRAPSVRAPSVRAPSVRAPSVRAPSVPASRGVR